MSSQRWLSVDVLRGLTIIAMLVVNNPGSWAHIYAPLRHADWHGLTPTDLVFPFFLFLVGVSITLSQRLQVNAGVPVRSILWRSGKLFAIGVGLALFNYQPLLADYSWWQDTALSVRWLGVLQRIALVYAACALLAAYWHGPGSTGRLLTVALLLLLIYTGLLMFVGYPLPDGSWTQGGLLPGNNLPAFVDHHLLGPQHVWQARSTPFASDPEGLLSTLPAIVTGLIGVLVGRWLQQPLATRLSVHSLTLIAGAMAVAGIFLHGWLPINKALWTPSYVLVTGGIAMAALLLLHRKLDGSTRAAASPITGVLLDYGSNALLAFIASGVAARVLTMVAIGSETAKSWCYGWLAGSEPGMADSLLFALIFTALFWPWLAWLRRVRRWSWRV